MGFLPPAWGPDGVEAVCVRRRGGWIAGLRLTGARVPLVRPREMTMLKVLMQDSSETTGPLSYPV